MYEANFLFIFGCNSKESFATKNISLVKFQLFVFSLIHLCGFAGKYIQSLLVSKIYFMDNACSIVAMQPHIITVMSLRAKTEEGFIGYIRIYHDGIWGAICRAGWSDIEADLSCR
jgi:hypothetical protein